VERAPQHRKIVIVGAGFSGIGMAIRLKQSGTDDFVILERAPDVGGAWHFNTYPGCRCDVPSHLYSFSFAPNPNWSNTYSPQPEIRDYLRRCAEEFGIRSHILTDVEVQGSAWNRDDQCWKIDTILGTFTARVLISGMGPLTEPKLPAVPGIESFEGKTMHSAQWDHTYELRGKRVASIGTGASAIQYVPSVQEQVEKLYVFQRTAPWIMPHGSRPISARERSVFQRVPVVQKLIREGVYWSKEALVLGFVKQPRLMGALERLSSFHMRRQVPDPGLQAKLAPDYSLGCKRILPSNDWYPALQQPNVELVSGGLQEVRASSVVDSNGRDYEVDAIIFGTGFHVADPPVADHVRGSEGRLMREVWEGTPRAYLGTSVPDFPNLFLLLGPNTGLGHSSMVYMIETQIEHVLQAIQAMDSHGASTIEVRPDVYEHFNQAVDARMRGTVWETGCSSFYQDATGRNGVLWPDWTWRFRRLATQFDEGAYVLSAPTPLRRGPGR
jgi:cation diffusion facilitator CzcD-associated flavoprotein CzcO